MPLPQQEWDHRIPNPLLQAEQYDVDEMAALVNEQRAVFNPEQATAFHAILCNTIATEVRKRGKVALCVASSGIAALLLDGGRTSHSRFKIPMPIHENSVAGLKRSSYMFQVIQQTKVPIQHKYDIDAVDQCLRDLLEVSINLHLIAIELTYYLE